MRKYARLCNLRGLLCIGAIVGLVHLAQADTIHFSSGTITATYDGMSEVIGNTVFRMQGHQGSLAAWGTMEAGCSFCGAYDQFQKDSLSPLLHLGVQTAVFQGSETVLWGGLVISGNAFLLPPVHTGYFTATIPVEISGWFVNPDDFFTVPKKGIMRIKFAVEDGNWHWYSAQITMVPEPTTLLLFGTGLGLLGFGLRHRLFQKAH